jgi:DNA invertase Pin-like site-specific DNA recombinase
VVSDLGVSAFNGKNATHGALAGFLLAAKNKKVPAGSILLVESLDRLSRNSVSDAIELLTSIVRSGIRVVSMIDNKEWNNETINDMMSFMFSVMLFARAHEESATKSKRVRAAFMKKREAGLPVISGGHGPGWARPSEDNQSWLLDKVKAESVKKVFQMATAGKGGIAIARLANLEEWPLPWRKRANTNTRWEHTGVSRILRDRRVLGEYQPKRMLEGNLVFDGEPVKNYYPKIITDDLWYLAQSALAGRTGPVRIRGIKADIFAGLLYCKCEERLDRKSPTSRGYPRYYCLGRNAGVSSCNPLSEAALVEHALPWLVAAEYAAFSPDLIAKATRDSLAQAEAKKEDIGVRISRLIATLEESGPSPILLGRLAELDKEKIATEGEIQNFRAVLADVKQGVPAFGISIAHEAALAVKNKSAVEARHRISSSIAQVVSKIIWNDPFVDFRLKDGSSIVYKVPDTVLKRTKRKDRKILD